MNRTPSRTALSVNLNKVATVRNTRHLGTPSVVRAATLCLQAGAAGITVHPRPDERHIRTHDVFDLGALLQAWPEREFNIEGNPSHNLLEVAAAVRERGLPLHQLTLVPDGVGQLTSDHGWRFPQDAATLAPLVAQAKALGARVSLFMDPDAEHMLAAKAVGADRIELYTEPYAAAWLEPDASERARRVEAELQRYAADAQAALDVGLGVNAGHDLNLINLGAFVSRVPGVSEVSIGHALIGDALELGYSAAVAAYLACLRPSASAA